METILERVGQVWQPTSYGNNPGGVEWTGIRVAALVISQAARLKGEAASVGQKTEGDTQGEARKSSQTTRQSGGPEGPRFLGEEVKADLQSGVLERRHKSGRQAAQGCKA